jgi:predicted nucleic acid-binding protein
MKIVIDTSALIAVITNEPKKGKIIETTLGAELLAPPSVHWEIANAFSAMFKQKRISLENSIKCIGEYNKIPLRFLDVDLNNTLELSFDYNIYAYDAFLISCCLSNSAPLLTLDKSLFETAKLAKVNTLEI